MVSNLRIYLHPQNRQHILLFKNFRTFLGNHFPIPPFHFCTDPELCATRPMYDVQCYSSMLSGLVGSQRPKLFFKNQTTHAQMKFYMRCRIFDRGVTCHYRAIMPAQ